MTTTLSLQTQNSLGEWTARPTFDLARCVGQSYRTRTGYNVVESVEQAADLLARGFEIQYGTDWYENVRNTPAPRVPAAPSASRTSLGYDRSALGPNEGFYGAEG